jgi:hypothetical protein
VTGYPACGDCGAPVKFRHRELCHVCHRRAVRAAAKRGCRQCGRLRHLLPSGTCAGCARAAAPRKPPKTITCVRCGERRRNAGHGLCNRCTLADPDRPFRYAASAARRLGTAPAWWDELTAFTVGRYHPGGAMTILRETARILTVDPTATPQQILQRCTPVDQATALVLRALTAFFTGRGLALPDDAAQRRAAQRRQRYLDAIPAPLRPAVIAFDRAQLDERERDRRAGRRQLSDITLESRLRVLRDLAAHLTAARHITGWAEVTSNDLELFLPRRPATGTSRPMCCAASSAGPDATSLSSPIRPGGYRWAPNPRSPAPSSTLPDSVCCSAGGPATPFPRMSADRTARAAARRVER